MNSTTERIGILGGSGLYAFEGLVDVVEHAVDTPYGTPSDVIVTGRLGSAQVAFLARHGRGHRLIPSEVPYRANIYALKELGVRSLLAISAVGSLREHVAPLDLVLPDQFLDLTRKRESTFFGDGIVAHVSMAEPTCAALRERAVQAFEALALPSVRMHRAATYACIEGPAFSTRAESAMLRTLGADIVGMTNMPEARLAREAQIAYATLALVTDYDCWDAGRAPVSAELAISNLTRNAEVAQKIAAAVIQSVNAQALQSEAHQALRSALVTPLAGMTASQRARVDILLR
ncbi:MAG: S-methyl-5'-thioadenosine phosphorylase [Xanthomonadaceae bacterium]|nr:S-methyl-5'-thioadenosine phosphorylase [Xanthomonadaceae bacterium]